MESKRDDLVRATKALLWQLGYESMSPRTVLKASGAGQGSLYHHFAGKKHLAAVALDEIADEMCADADRVFDDSLAPLTRVQRFLGAERDGLRGCRLGRLANERSIEDAELRKPIARYFRHVHAHLASALREAKRRKDLPGTVNVESLAVTLLAAVQGGYVLSRIHRDGAYLKEAARGAWRMVRALQR